MYQVQFGQSICSQYKKRIPTSQLKREVAFEKIIMRYIIARARELATVGTHNNFYE